jgi:hypothetical protein
LKIDPVSFEDAGSYDVVVTDSCGPVTSNAASLSVEFADVPLASPFHDDIISIATEGITSGCGGGNYCPTSPCAAIRWPCSSLKSEHGSAYTPPACIGVFADVPCPGSSPTGSSSSRPKASPEAAAAATTARASPSRARRWRSSY